MESPKQFTPSELNTLQQICDTLIPALQVPDDPHGFYACAASDLKLAHKMVLTIERVADAGMIGRLRSVLGLLEKGWFNGLLAGQWQAFSDLDLAGRTALLNSWENSILAPRRQLFQSLKRLTCFLFYTVLDETAQNPNWPAIGYTPSTTPTPEKPISVIKPTLIEADTTLYADAVIIGSGAGGGVVAAKLSAAGLDVIVLEKGGHYTESDFDGQELSGTRRLFEQEGLYTNSDQSIAILAGSTLGGGTTINWTASLRTPDTIQQEWVTQYGLPNLSGAEFQLAYERVAARLHVNTDESHDNPQNANLERGAKNLNLNAHVIPRNVQGCGDCGLCGFGCRLGAKQSTLRTYLQDAYDHNARVITRAYADKILIERGKVIGVAAMITGVDGQPHSVVIKTKCVVASAGTLHTPALLLRSELSNYHIGRNLHLHPATATYGFYPTPVPGWTGPMMSRYVDAFCNLDGRGHGVMLEAGPIHPGLVATGLPWVDGLQHKQDMQKLAHFSNIIVLARDSSSGQVVLNSKDQPIVHYALNSSDAAHIKRGILESLKIHVAAGADEIGTPFAMSRAYKVSEGQVDNFLEAVAAMPLRPNNFALFSAHQVGSCRMGVSPAHGAVGPTGETFEVKGLYVADGSVLPSAPGVNPMITIMTVAELISGYIKDSSA